MLLDLSMLAIASDVVDWFYQWQTLVGAILGGVFSLAVAFIVASDARLREQRSGALMLMRDIVRVQVIEERLRANGLEDPKSFETAQRLVGALVKDWPGLSSRYEESASRVATVQVRIAAHLHLIQERCDAIERVLAEKRKPNQAAISHERGFAAEVHLAQGLWDHISVIAQHAACGQSLLESLVLGSQPARLWARWRLRFWQKSSQCACERLLLEGSPGE